MTQDDMNNNQQEAKSGGVIKIVAFVLLLLVAVGAFIKIIRNNELTAQASENNKGAIFVRVVSPSKPSANGDISLPGNIEALREVPIYARSNGYLKSRLVDIGDKVVAGQLMAEMDSPEVDQELNQTIATLAQVKANLRQMQANRDLAKITLKRFESLQKEQMVSQQSYDEKEATFNARQADVEAAQAAVNSSQANVQRLRSLKTFQQIKAPFSGVITKRNLSVDVGSLVSAGSSTSNQELFKIAQTDSLRIFINIPQSLVASVKEGQNLQVTLSQFPDKVFNGKITHLAGAMEQATRTLLIEVQIKNENNLLLPGMYAQVKIPGSSAASTLVIPGNALVIKAQGPQVALVDENNKIHFQQITLGRDYGKEVEVVGGLKLEDQLVINPSDEVQEGTKVQISRSVEKTAH